jgi:L-fuconolactonase
MNERGPDMSKFFPIRPDWLDLASEPALNPDLPIIDSHHHLWDFGGFHYMFDELLADISHGHNIVGTVYAQCSTMYRANGPEHLRPVGETEFANGIAAMGASGLYGGALVCDGIVGYANLMLGAAVEEVLQAHIAAGGGRFRGIRHTVCWDPDESLLSPLNKAAPGMLMHPTYRAGVSRLAPLGLSYDAWLFHTQLDELADLAGAFPETSIVLVHQGGPIRIGRYASQRDEAFADWAAGIRRVAAFPNVVVKLGGLGMRVFGFELYNASMPPSSELLARLWRPYIETCIDAFGPRRCMFESNFPVDKASYSYGTLWNAFKRLTAGLTAEERADLFSGTAQRVYRLSSP